MASNFYKIHKEDNVVVSLSDGMKYAVRDISSGEQIIKYGYPIGVASVDIEKGNAVHVFNIRSMMNGKNSYPPYRKFRIEIPSETGAFMGFRRKNNKVGIRNDIFIIPTVGCVNGICEKLSKETGAIALTHPYGCSQLGDDHKRTREILCGLALHPNAGGVLIVSLGCENNTLDSFKELLNRYEYDIDRIKFMTVQNEADEIAKGITLISELKEKTAIDKRTPCPLYELTIGLKCGGSDAMSGITANPLVGRISDKIVALGGSSVLTEIPEMFGAESVMLSRCVDESVYNALIRTVDNFKDYYIRNGERIDENPSPGNKEGGISTLADKSLGCVQKGGTTAVIDVIDYGDQVANKGLSVLNGRGNDIVACTALAAAGAHIVLFTTGRGTPLGGAVPILKISSNTALYEKKPSWIDFNAGELLDDNADKEKTTHSLFSLIMQIAEGKPTKSEENNYHEIAIWKNGVTL